MKKYIIAGIIIITIIVLNTNILSRTQSLINHQQLRILRIVYTAIDIPANEGVDTVWVPHSVDTNYKAAIIHLYNEDTPYNSLFIHLKKKDDKFNPISTDSLWTNASIEYSDYNNDGTKDILISHTSSARSNQTYYLYLVDKQGDGFRKVRNFEQIPNPTFDSINNVIMNYVLSGTNYTDFYKIEADSVLNLNMTIEDTRPENDEDNTSHYDNEYKKAIKRLQHINKKAPQPK